MAERIVINTGPLIALARAEALDVAGGLPYSFVCPPQVKAELEVGTARGHASIDPPWLEVVPLSDPLNKVSRAALDEGEAAVIQLALEHTVRVVCIDESKGRRMALAVGLQVTGTLGLLARAKNLGLIASMRPYTERLTSRGGWYDKALIEAVLRGVGE